MDNTTFYTCYRQHKILYSSETAQDCKLVTDHTRSYTRYRHKILYSSQTTQDSILVRYNTRLYTRNRRLKILYSLDTQNSILVTDDITFYTRHRLQDSIVARQHLICKLITHNTRFQYSPQTKQRFLYSPRTTQDYYTRH